MDEVTRNQEEFKHKLQRQMEKDQLDVMLLTNAESIYYATGVASPFAYQGAQPGTIVAIVPKEGEVSLVTTEFEAGLAKLSNAKLNVISYPIWIYVADFSNAGKKRDIQPDTNKTLKMAAQAAKDMAAPIERVGVEASTMPYEKMLALHELFGKDRIVNCEHTLIEAKTIKTLWEIEVLKKNAQATEKAMKYAAENTCVGMSEMDMLYLWNQACAKEENREFYGRSYSICIAEQYTPFVLPRRDIVLKNGDLVRLDAGLFADAYTADIARTYAVGTQIPDERRRIYEVLLSAHDLIFNMIAPGVKMCDVFDAALKHIQKTIPDFIRGHFGHSIGCNRFAEEYPMIGDGETRVFEPGMVFSVEVPYYSTFNNSFNIEDSCVITENGVERFTYANRDLIWK